MGKSSSSSTYPMPTREAGTSSTDPRAVSAGRRILILHVRAGVGHERAARAVEAALRSLDPTCEPIVRDALDFSSPFLRTFYASSYNRLVDRVPRVWGFFYRRAERIPARSFRQRLRSAILAAGCRDFITAARRFRADAILCTQFLPVEVFSLFRERGLVPVPVYCAVTDFSIHPIWVYPGIDRYFVATEAANLLVGKAGGLTSSEAMARGVPIVALRPIPGQEERNVDYLQESGAAVRVHDLFELRVKLAHFLADPADLERMKANARAIGRPDSAFRVARSILTTFA